MTKVELRTGSRGAHTARAAIRAPQMTEVELRA